MLEKLVNLFKGNDGPPPGVVQQEEVVVEQVDHAEHVEPLPVNLEELPVVGDTPNDSSVPRRLEFKPMPLVAPSDPVLRAVAQLVHEDELAKAPLAQLAGNMLATMYAGGGCGLAANQVGVLKRIIVVDPQEHGERSPVVMVNPIISDRLGHKVWSEGCLTSPGVRRRVKRAKQLKVTYTNLDGVLVVRRLYDLEAAIVQHEVDHLNGILFTDRRG